MKAGFIGYRHFAEKLKMLFEETGGIDEFLFFHPEKDIKGLLSTRKIGDLLSCDFIVIASPDWTHASYLRQLKDYKGYIFCEKIPVINRKDLMFLRTYPNSKLYIDFNYRKSHLYDILRGDFGKILYINCRIGHGLGLKKTHKDNWRANSHYAPLGVFQVSGFHFFDLLIFCFGRPVSYHCVTRNISPYGNSVDNFDINLEFKGKITANLFFSYTSPYLFNFDIITTQYLISVTEKDLIIRGPRETYDKKTGLFALPPVVLKKKFDLYQDSLKSSIEYFLGVVRRRGKFLDSKSKNHLLSTEVFLDILDEEKARNKRK